MNAALDRFSTPARRLIEGLDHELILSAASAWEIATKHALGKLRLPVPPREYLASRLALTRVVPLAISHDHALRTGELPPHHRDPFDRLLIAQAQIERLAVLTSDPKFDAYDIETIPAASDGPADG